MRERYRARACATTWKVERRRETDSGETWEPVCYTYCTLSDGEHEKLATAIADALNRAEEANDNQA